MSMRQSLRIALFPKRLAIRDAADGEPSFYEGSGVTLNPTTAHKGAIGDRVTPANY